MFKFKRCSMEEIKKEEIELLYEKFDIKIQTINLSAIVLMHEKQLENLLNDFSINNQVYIPKEIK